APPALPPFPTRRSSDLTPAEPGARRQHHERARAPPGAEAPLAQRQRIDVVVDEGGDAEARGEALRQGHVDEIGRVRRGVADDAGDRKSTRLNSSHVSIS